MESYEFCLYKHLTNITHSHSMGASGIDLASVLRPGQDLIKHASI